MTKKIFPTPTDCELAFYDAFERSDINLMMTVWADEPDIICIHPNGPRLAGIDAIRESFTQIFSHGVSAQVQIGELRRHSSQTFAIHNIYETLIIKDVPEELKLIDQEEAPVILTTNIYQLTSRGWRMVLHHSSVAPQGTTAEDQGVSRILH
ncbi:MAG: nuclear transport factor 2 family protein [Betaproteobacteria bacterium]|nr:nuclear transport factor 2 family protein [Betaproteobacteria bacterium]